MATPIAESLESKIYAGLCPHCHSHPLTPVHRLANNIAFLLRFKLGPNVPPNQVAIVVGDINDSERQIQGQSVGVVVQEAPGSVTIIVAEFIPAGQSLIVELNKEVDRRVGSTFSTANLSNGIDE
ncbi:hypothetical protein CC86DRAFT_407189 [Ophiobolus disseminans]|uniref:Uncharacterized protein n=1 Tax=Ophiobolus disseminans TaxID=1469910 RepID=A0A6A7A045_9PLEO|nr:hypothetical protein CC86DRAFT_407189 [Ophiobolus disseminans]